MGSIDDSFVNVDLADPSQVEKHPSRLLLQHGSNKKYLSSAGWWQAEYWWLLGCVTTATCLVVLLQCFDNQAVPQLG